MAYINRGSNKKFSIVQIIRHTIQLIAFILLPGLFISVFFAIKEIYVSVISGTFNLTELAEPFVLVLTVVLITLIGGRFFCGFLCSFGAMGDLLWTISSKFRKKKRKINDKLDSALKYIKYIILILTVILVWTLGYSMDSSYNPWTIFGMYASIKSWSAPEQLLSLGTVFLLLIIIGSLFVERFFCRYLCPLGAIFSLFSHARLYRIKKPVENCGKCTLCSFKCSMGIPLEGRDMVDSGECINCFHCVDVCPGHNVTANPAPAVAGATAAIAITGLYYAGISYTDKIGTDDSKLAVTADALQNPGAYADGTYTGEGQGFRGTVLVQVTVENGNISDIEVTSTQDDKDFFDKAQKILIQSMITDQTAEVDAVSGATSSSNGIIAAVNDALKKAANEPEGSSAEKEPENSGDAKNEPEGSQKTEGENSAEDKNSVKEQTKPNTETSDDMTGKNEINTTSDLDLSNVADGVYTGTGNGYRGEIKVSVTVSGRKIQDISVETYQDDEAYFERARSVLLDEVMKEQNLNVDTVSGATNSSNGILEAISNALGVSLDNADIESSQDQQSQGTGQGQQNGEGDGQGQRNGEGNGQGQQNGEGNGQGRQNGEGNGVRERRRNGRR